MTYQEKVNSIYDGWKNWIKRNPDREVLARERADVCANCIHSTFINNLICKKCGCIIPAKIRSRKEKCPLKLW